MLANCHRDPKRRPQPYHPKDFHPYADHETTPRTATPTATIDYLKALLPDP